MTENKKIKRNHSKGDLIKVIKRLEIQNRTLMYNLYWTNLLNNPCFESERLQAEWKNA